jgi:hypothetical protein
LKVLRAEIVPSCDFVVTLRGASKGAVFGHPDRPD